MAEISSTMNKEVTFCKTVQELVENGDTQVPDTYIWRDTTNFGAIDLTAPLAPHIPVIDFSQLFSSSESAVDAELDKLRSALSSWGCFQAINHGIEDSLLEQIRQVSRHFFHMPIEEKQKVARPVDGFEGYGNDMVLFNNQPLDWVDRLYLLVTPKDQQKLQYWPENPQSFRNILHEYTTKMEHIQEQLLKSIARSINLPEDCFLNQFGEKSIMFARFNYYPPCSRPDQVLGLKPHADGSGITILLQDEQLQGLQVKKDDQWYQVPIIPNAFLINLGDQVEIMSNGILKSPVHRALTNSDKERFTVAMFYAPDPELEIGPVEELVDDKNPRLYKNIKNYPEIFFHYYQQGKRQIEAVRI